MHLKTLIRSHGFLFSTALKSKLRWKCIVAIDEQINRMIGSWADLYTIILLVFIRSLHLVVV